LPSAIKKLYLFRYFLWLSERINFALLWEIIKGKNNYIKQINQYIPLAAILLFLVLSSGCAINKFIPDDKVLLINNQVKLKKSELTRRQLDRDRIKYVVPKPRYGLGKGYLNVYFKHSDPQDTSWWDRFVLKKLSEKPMWYTPEGAEQTKEDLIKHLNASGYYQGEVTYKVKQNDKKASVVYTVAPGVPLRISSIEYISDNAIIQHILDSIQSELSLAVGNALDEQVLIPDQAKIIQALQDAGYYQISKSSFDYYYSDSTHQSIDLKCTVSPLEGQNDFKQYHISQINVYSYDRLTDPAAQFDTVINNIHYASGSRNPILKPAIFEKYIDIRQGELFHLSALQRTRNTFQNLGIYRSVSIIPEVTALDSLAINLYMPAVKKKYVQVDLETSYVTNKTQVGGNKLLDLRLALQYRHRNLFKGGEQFTASVIPNIGFQLVEGQLLIPRGLNTQLSLALPRFLEIGFVRMARQARLISDKLYSDIKNGSRTRINVANVYDLFFNSFEGITEPSVQRESKISFGYEFTKDNRIFYRFNPVGFDYLNYDLSAGFLKVAPEFLKKSFEDRLLAGLVLKEITMDINNQYANQNFSRVLLSFESSGIETGLVSIFTKNPVLPKVSRFGRLDIDGRFTWRLSGTDQFGFRLATGIALPFGSSDNSIPFIRQFYVGGPNSIRGWAIREIGPGIVKNDIQNNRFSFYQTGNFKLEFGSEYRFDIFSVLKGAFLFDGGNVWLLKKDPLLEGGELSSKFLSQVYLSSGAGIRLDFGYFLIRFDAGLKLRTPYLQENGTHTPTFRKLNDLQFNLSLGLPF
ncbi:MAG: BamA/TamA family outer membrane protein, partial [Saprospiraceae bacterium]|nr:BamA/TamA family outer membrane protein [Saprospiraceae bacterium]